jgi:hypothetical protein
MVGDEWVGDRWWYVYGLVRNVYEMVENTCCGDMCSGTKKAVR